MITGKDIADATGFALSTVAKVLRGHAERYKINQKTSEMILKTAEQLGYHRNEAAVITRTGVNRTIAILALVTPNMHAVQSMIISGIMMEAASYDYAATIFNSQEDPAKIFGTILSKRIQKIIYVADRNAKRKEVAELCRKNGITLIFISEGPEDEFPVVRTDDRNGIRQGIAHLAANGHRRIGIISAAYYPERLLGAKEALKENGLAWLPDFTYIHTGDLPLEHMLTAIEKMFSRENLPTAFSCITDDIALMIMMVANRKGLRIPEDISVVGYGNAYPIVQYAVSPLTTVVQPFQDVGRTAFRLAVGKSSGVREFPERCYQLPTNLLIRESVFHQNSTPEDNFKSI